MPSVNEVIIATLSTPLACPTCGNRDGHTHPDFTVWSPVTVRAELIEAALIHHGHVKAPDAPVTEADLAHAAVSLAHFSQHPRYEGDDGVLRLRKYPVDVDVAYHAALRHHDDPLARADLARWRTLLLNHLQDPE